MIEWRRERKRMQRQKVRLFGSVTCVQFFPVSVRSVKSVKPVKGDYYYYIHYSRPFFLLPLSHPKEGTVCVFRCQKIANCIVCSNSPYFNSVAGTWCYLGEQGNPLSTYARYPPWLTQRYKLLQLP
jgi:hypothetical protein